MPTSAISSLVRRVGRGISQVARAVGRLFRRGGPGGVDRPDLEGGIVADNVLAARAIYHAAMLEEVKLFQVADRIAELFRTGALPLVRGHAGDRLFAYWKKSLNRMGEAERRAIYARVLGVPSGSPEPGVTNREFDGLFLRFCEAVAGLARQASPPVSQEDVRRAGRDLAANVSLHGFGVVHFAATELQEQIREIVLVLSEPEVRSAYGARDMWEVVDRVAALELGGARNAMRYRTLATAGAIVLRWLATHVELLEGDRTPVLDPRRSGTTTNPGDKDLVEAVEQWLAATAPPEET